jgi:DNA-binding NtrC family response regulator
MSYANNCERAETGPGPDAEPDTAAPDPNGRAPGFGCVYLTRSVREATRASALVESARIRIYHATGLADALERLTLTGSRVLLTDTAFARGNWRDALQVVAGLRPSVELVVAARLADERLWLGVLERGAYDLILKPFQEDELCRVLENAHNHAIAGGSRRMTA